MYSSLGLFGLVFMLHGIYLDGFAIQRERLALRWMILMAALNFIGAAFYATTVSRLHALHRMCLLIGLSFRSAGIRIDSIS